MSYSVLMSVYRKEKPEYFKLAIESMLNQTVKSDDFVIVCDGPLTEGLEKVIADYVVAYPGLFNVFRLMENKGLAIALNNGILQCKNEIIVRMDTDDISVKDRVETQLGVLEKYGADIVGSNIIEFENDISNTKKVREVPIDNQDIINFAKKRNPFNHPSIMFKKSKVIEAGFYQDFKYFEDYNLWVTMLNKNAVGRNIPENLVYMRGGEDLYKRRGGVKYARCIYRFLKNMRKIGFISFREYIVNIVIRVGISLVPNFVRKLMYNNVLRS